MYNFRNVYITPVSCLWDNYAYLIVDLEKSNTPNPKNYLRPLRSSY